ncbi:hypothetical protein D3H55_08820 [Bacillus salacetis]|uniref:Uncharacterized protein n=1 Tax=Bacillus salacetis TaxID=2315464 RepID=A0A3A1R6L6_9BACI|nr:hypothetical protein [Bacillus salacetis]RIW35137.1 hypothetical protein D3H55_08820 [Bacillus salacetis]
MASDTNELVKQLQEMNKGLMKKLIFQQQTSRSQQKVEDDFKREQESLKESLKEHLDLSDHTDLADLLSKLR